MDFRDIFQSQRKFYMRDFRNAYRFRPDVNPVRQKFQGYVNFILNRDLYGTLYGENAASAESKNAGGDFRTTISSLVKTAEIPSVEFKTETLKAYNKKRIVNTGVEYQPVNLTVYDTVNNEWLITLMKYFSYHYMNPRNEQTPGNRDMQLPGGKNRSGSSALYVSDSEFGRNGSSMFDSNSDGYNPNITSHFFERIDYVLYHGQRGVQYSLFNPVLTSFKSDTIDYSSSEAMQFDLTFEYEKFTVYNKTNFNLAKQDVNRFEDASKLFGDNLFTQEPLIAEQDLAILGNVNENTSRSRSLQQYSRAPVPNETRTGGLPATYSGVTSAGEAPKPTTGNQVLFGIFDSALSAAINGGSIRDAAIQTAVSGVTRIISESGAQNAENPDGNQDDGTSNQDNT